MQRTTNKMNAGRNLFMFILIYDFLFKKIEQGGANTCPTLL
jgi:hypothetical protein